MTFIDITCMSDRSEEVIIETFPRRNDTPFFTTRSCRLTMTFDLKLKEVQYWRERERRRKEFKCMRMHFQYYNSKIQLLSCQTTDAQESIIQ